MTFSFKKFFENLYICSLFTFLFFLLPLHFLCLLILKFMTPFKIGTHTHIQFIDASFPVPFSVVYTYMCLLRLTLYDCITY